MVIEVTLCDTPMRLNDLADPLDGDTQILAPGLRYLCSEHCVGVVEDLTEKVTDEAPGDPVTKATGQHRFAIGSEILERLQIALFDQNFGSRSCRVGPLAWPAGKQDCSTLDQNRTTASPPCSIQPWIIFLVVKPLAQLPSPSMTITPPRPCTLRVRYSIPASVAALASMPFI